MFVGHVDTGQFSWLFWVQGVWCRNCLQWPNWDQRQRSFGWLVCLLSCREMIPSLLYSTAQSPSSNVFCEGHKGSQCIWWNTESLQLSSWDCHESAALFFAHQLLAAQLLCSLCSCFSPRESSRPSSETKRRYLLRLTALVL